MGDAEAVEDLDWVGSGTDPYNRGIRLLKQVSKFQGFKVSQVKSKSKVQNLRINNAGKHVAYEVRAS